MGAQDLLNGITNSVVDGIQTAGKIKEGLDKKADAEFNAQMKQPTGIDAKMAAKARKTAQEKINAIYANKELSNKAKTQRIGKVMDEFSNLKAGGKK